MSVQVRVEQHEGASQCVGSICCHRRHKRWGKGQATSTKVQSCEFHHQALRGKSVWHPDWWATAAFFVPSGCGICRFFLEWQWLSEYFKGMEINCNESSDSELQHSYSGSVQLSCGEESKACSSYSNLRRWASVGCTGRSVWKNAQGPSPSPASLPWVEKPLRSSCCTQINPRGRRQVKRLPVMRLRKKEIKWKKQTKKRLPSLERYSSQPGWKKNIFGCERKTTTVRLLF